MLGSQGLALGFQGSGWGGGGDGHIAVKYRLKDVSIELAYCFTLGDNSMPDSVTLSTLIGKYFSLCLPLEVFFEIVQVPPALGFCTLTYILFVNIHRRAEKLTCGIYP